ncbi:MAG: helix-turn-helix transcriptional regulator [Bacteroidales bacterium]|nr:helix-turn-helix transcriptional regulator [Bacteroidales bacterium]MBN2758361.1 helix-turn-helix transcriptional regulator [Bacteroidales bacterium]
MSFFGKNIKKIRAAKKLSQTAFADLFRLKRASIGAYEEGRAEAKIDTIIEIANYFKLTLNQLLTKELTLNEIYRISSFTNENLSTISNKIPFVKNINFADYIIKNNDENFLKSLEKIILPDNKKKLIAFEYIGDKMANFQSGIKHGDILICENILLENIDKIAENTIIVAVSKQDILIGRFTYNNKTLKINYDNPAYSSNQIKIEKINKLFLAKKIISNL